MGTIDRRDFLKGLGAGAAGIYGPGALAGSSRGNAQEAPHIVYILADDLGFGDVGYQNADSKIPTPNIDRLARQGRRFTDAHSSSAVCTPTRYGLLTGRYSWRTRLKKGVLWPPAKPLISRHRMTAASLLKRQGYSTACVGKWHLGIDGGWKDRDWSKPLKGGPVDRGFDYYFGIPASLDIPPYYYIENDRVVEPPTEHIEASHTEGVTKIQGAFWREGGIAPNFRHEEVQPTLIEKSRKFIKRQHKNSPDSPFFLYLPLAAPHTPWLPLDEYRGVSGAGMYGDFVAQVDDGVGRVLSLLESLDIRDDTLVFFSSDNGPVWFRADRQRTGHDATGPLRGMKIDAWEGGHRMPFLARWPGNIPAGCKSDEPVAFTDMLATFASLVGDELEAGQGSDSFDISDILTAPYHAEKLERPTIIQDRAVLHDGWKLIYGNAQGGLSRRYGAEKHPRREGWLYDLDEDLGETNNLYKDRPDVAERLRGLVKKAKKKGHTRPMG